ncbi:MAG: hypothetical protein COB69_07485 [Phycisphaera sp.]|nr:MAG: hypothetical protein COB69_07485 [Phycisphaera sp.]
MCSQISTQLPAHKHTSTQARQMFVRGAQVLVGGVLFAAAVVKAAEPAELLEAIRFILPIESRSAWYLLIGIVLFEILLGSAMLAGLAVKQLLVLAFMLSLGFVAWTAYLEIIDAPVGCGCGTSRLLGLTSTNRWASLGVSGSMVVLCGTAAFVAGRSQKSQVLESQGVES